MTYNAKVPLAIYKLHFHPKNQTELKDLSVVRLVFEFVVVDEDFEKMNLRWHCPKFFKRGILDEVKCEEVKKDIYKWIRWSNKDSFVKTDLL